MAGKSTPKKQSVSTELVLGQAAQQITKAVAELNAATASVNQLASQTEELTLQVSNKEAQIAELEVLYAEKARQAEVEFGLDMKANAEAVLNDYLSSEGKVAISEDEFDSLKKELADTKANADAETKKEVAIVSNTLKTKYENDLRFIQSDNKATAAENASKIGVLMEKNKFLEEQVTKLYHQLELERIAGVDRAKASSVGTIQVGTDSKR